MSETTLPAASAVVASPTLARLARPRWSDARLLLGVLLVLTSLATGARVMAGADRTAPVWAASRALAPGIELTSADVEVRAVRLDAAAGNYLAVGVDDPVGRVLTRAVSAGDLLPAAAVVLSAGLADQRRQVTVPVSAFHYPPDLSRGAVVDVYVTASAASPASPAGVQTGTAAGAQLAIAGAVVVEVTDGGSGFGGPSASVGVVLSVSADQVASLVGGVRAGPVDLVRVAQP
jgi:hypothetical protein